VTSLTTDIVETALDWHLRQAGLTEAGWAEFIAWLEADPRHAEAYDRVAFLDGQLTAPRLAPRVAAANDDAAPPRRWRVALFAGGGAAMAAGLAALLLIQPGGAAPRTVATADGETRSLVLADGTRVEMSGGTRLRIDAASPRSVEIETGEAVFHVRHDARAPFTVRSRRLAVQDLGTVFDVMREGDRFGVQVAEGSVLFQPGREAVRLAPGQAVSVDEARGQVQVGRIAPDLVGGWRRGRLAFSAEPVAGVARRVERLSGTRLVVDSRLSAIRVTGMITLSGEARSDVPHIASLVGANWRQDGERWILSPAEKP
jgi:transmembrane sensor